MRGAYLSFAPSRAQTGGGLGLREPRLGPRGRAWWMRFEPG